MQIWDKFDEICLFKLELEEFSEKGENGDLAWSFFEKASLQPVMFLKNNQNCPNYSIVAIVSSSPYFETLFSSLGNSNPTMLILYLFKQRIVEDQRMQTI